jgi:hypothetical protein
VVGFFDDWEKRVGNGFFLSPSPLSSFLSPTLMSTYWAVLGMLKATMIA